MELTPETIRDARLAHGHSLAAAAAACGVTEMTYRRWENGHSTPKDYEAVTALIAYVGRAAESE